MNIITTVHRLTLLWIHTVIVKYHSIHVLLSSAYLDTEFSVLRATGLQNPKGNVWIHLMARSGWAIRSTWRAKRKHLSSFYYLNIRVHEMVVEGDKSGLISRSEDNRKGHNNNIFKKKKNSDVSCISQNLEYQHHMHYNSTEEEINQLYLS